VKKGEGTFKIGQKNYVISGLGEMIGKTSILTFMTGGGSSALDLGSRCCGFGDVPSGCLLQDGVHFCDFSDNFFAIEIFLFLHAMTEMEMSKKHISAA
jgi:hypothetical protein